MAQESKIPVFTEQFRLSLVQRRVLVLDGVLDDDNGTLLAAQLLTLADEDPDTDVALWINSPGGSIPYMLAIRDIMRLIPCDVSSLAFGIACSAGQFLLSAGTKGKRFALPHARILMHQGSSGIGGSAVDIQVQADELRHTVGTVLGIMCAATGTTASSMPSSGRSARSCRPGDTGSGCRGPRRGARYEQLHHPERDRPASA